MIKRKAVVTCVLATAALIPLTSTGPASAEPGVPQAPTVVFTEDFENGMGSAPVLVTDYAGAPPVSQTYTADPAYLVACSGWITSPLNGLAEPPGAGCGGFWEAAKLLSDALGDFAGDPDTNHGLMGYTHVSPGVDKVQLETENPIPLAGPNRFVTVGLDASALGCFGLHSLWTFYVLDGANALSTFSSPLDPCANPDETINGVAVGSYLGDTAPLVTGSTAGIRLVNGQGDQFGNDSGMDNIQLLDVTPQLDKAFSVESAETNTPVTLTFTVTNTSELLAKNGWSFTDTLPDGLSVAPGSEATTCAGGSVAGGTDSVSVSGNLTGGQVSCTATVQVTATQPGTYTNCAANISAVAGLNPPGCTSVEFKRPPLVFDAHAHGARATGLINVPRVAPSDVSCADEPDADTSQVLNASLPTLGTLGVINTSAAGEIDEDGLRSARAQASTATVRLLGGLVTADEVVSRATATEDSSGDVSAGGSVTLTNLRVAGVPITVNPPPNTTVNIPLVATVVINEQTPTAGGNGISVNALHITLLTGTHIVVSHADVALLRAGDPCPPS